MLEEKFEKQKSDFYFEYDLIWARKNKSQLPEANHQKEAIKSLKKWFDSNKYPSGTIVALPTGSGKTFTAVRFLSKHVLSRGYKVLWLAHTHHLLEQAYYSFGPANNDVKNGYEVGWIQEPKNKLNIRVVSGTNHHYDVSQIKADDDVIIATLQTIANANNKSHHKFVDFIKSAEGKLFIVFDEAHHAPAPTYRNLIFSLRDKFPEMHLLGLTATPTYVDIKKRGWLKEIFPQTIVYQAQVKNLMLEGILAKPLIEESGTNFTPEFDEREFLKWRQTNKKVPEHIVTQLASNQGRNQFIADSYFKDKDRYGKTIMFADRWYQCEQLSKFLQDKGIRADTMYTRTDNERNAEVLDKFRNNELDVIINIKMLTEGTDVPDVDTVFVTRQTTSPISITQMVGRALRGPKFGGTDDANLVFFYDDWQKTINWATWDTDSWTGKKVYDPIDVDPQLEKISIDAVRRLIDMMDRGVNVNPGPFLTFLPTGWYQVAVSEIGEEGSPEEVNRVVMVFENEENDYLQFIDGLQNDNEILDDFDSDFVKIEDHMPRLKDWCESFFPNAERNIGEDMLENIFNITRHMAQNMKESPRFIKFEERKNHNLDVIAEKYIKKDYGPRTIDEKLRKEYNREDRYWKVIYYHYDLFKSQYNACVEYLLSKESTRPLTQEKIQVEKLKTGNLIEKIKACEILGEMGGEDNLHNESIKLLIEVSQDDKDSNVKKAAKKALEIINSLDLTDEEKQQIKERDGYVCLCCGEDRKHYLQVDHIIPRWNEVNNSETNLQTLCKICNITKSTQTIDFRETHSPLKNPLNEIPYIYRIKSAEKEQLNNTLWLEKFLKRSINFFYQSRAAETVDIDNNTKWGIILNKENDPQWIIPHLTNLKDKIKSERESYEYPGPNKIQILESAEGNGEEEVLEDEVLILIETLQHSFDDLKRRKAANKLGKIKDIRAVTVLIKALNDKDHFVARSAARALRLNNDKRSIGPLINKFKSGDSNLRMECRDALVGIGIDAIPGILKALTRKDRNTRELAVEALGGIGEKSTIYNLINALEDEESSVRWRAAKALSEFDDMKTIKPLKDALKDEDITVRKYAELSLKRKDDKKCNLFEKFDKELQKIDGRIRKNPIKSGFSYYSPQKVFLYAFVNEHYKISFWVYTGKEKIGGVKNHKTNPTWGSFNAYNETEILKALKIAENSLKLIRLETGEKLENKEE